MDVERRKKCSSYALTLVIQTIMRGFTYDEGTVIYKTIIDTMLMINATPDASDETITTEVMKTFLKYEKELNL